MLIYSTTDPDDDDDDNDDDDDDDNDNDINYHHDHALGKLATHDVLKTTHLTKTAPIFYLFSTVQQCFVIRRLFCFPSTVQQCFGPTAP
jgi:hypothetical protein